RRGVRHARVGLVVQSPPPPGATRLPPAGGVRGGILPPTGDSGSPAGTHELSSPENLGRFRESPRQNAVDTPPLLGRADRWGRRAASESLVVQDPGTSPHFLDPSGNRSRPQQ